MKRSKSLVKSSKIRYHCLKYVLLSFQVDGWLNTLDLVCFGKMLVVLYLKLSKSDFVLSEVGSRRLKLEFEVENHF